MIRPDTSAALGLGLDIGGTKTHGVVLDASNEVLADAVVPTGTGETAVRRAAVEVAGRLALDLGVRPGDFGTVGVGIPGLVDHRSGVVETAVNLGISRTNLSELLAGDFSVPIRIENDVKATALGAGLVLGTPMLDLCYVNLGTGLAAAAVSNGRLVRGARNGAGEIGHFAVDSAGEPCRCGQRGCLETVVGGSYLAPRLERLGLALPTLDTDPSPQAEAAREQFVAGVAAAVRLVVLTYDAAVVVLGGGVFRAAGWLLPAVKARLEHEGRSSSFLAGLAIADRLTAVPQDVPVAAIGAAAVGRKKGLRTHTDAASTAGPAISRESA